jgi:hypothetical protein
MNGPEAMHVVKHSSPVGDIKRHDVTLTIDNDGDPWEVRVTWIGSDTRARLHLPLRAFTEEEWGRFIVPLVERAWCEAALYREALERRAAKERAAP